MYKRNKNVKSGASMRARFQAGQKKKTAPETLPRKTDLSVTRVEQAASTPTRTNRPANSPAHKNLEIRQQAKSKVAPKTFTSSDLIGTEGMSAGEIVKRGPQGEPTRRPNESMTAYRQRLAKYRRKNK